MRDLTRAELFAMWMWGKEYSRQRLGAIEWYKILGQAHKDLVRDFITQYEAARARDLGASQETPDNG